MTIPSEFVKVEGIRVGDTVKVVLKPEKGLMIFSFSGIQQLPLSENFLRSKKK